MTDNLRHEVRSRGGIGKGAKWEWSVYDGDDPLPISSGEVTGAQSRADDAARAEIQNIRLERMASRPKRPRDANQLAKFIVDVATGEDVRHDPDTSAQREGGLAGGRGRSKSLTPGRRSEIARKAASARWKDKEPTKE